MAENGGLLYDPGSGTSRLLAPEPSEAFVARLRQRGVDELAVGRTIVATHVDRGQPGDAENDIAFLGLCGHAIAVANALPQVRRIATRVTAARGAGVEEFIASVLEAAPSVPSDVELP